MEVDHEMGQPYHPSCTCVSCRHQRGESSLHNSETYNAKCKCMFCQTVRAQQEEAKDIAAFAKATTVKQPQPLKVYSIEEVAAQETIVLRNMISKYDGICSYCAVLFKIGDRIRWSKLTGAMCFVDCTEGVFPNKSANKFVEKPIDKVERNFDFSDYGEK